jgi:hypothetical protein
MKMKVGLTYDKTPFVFLVVKERLEPPYSFGLEDLFTGKVHTPYFSPSSFAVGGLMVDRPTRYVSPPDPVLRFLDNVLVLPLLVDLVDNKTIINKIKDIIAVAVNAGMELYREYRIRVAATRRIHSKINRKVRVEDRMFGYMDGFSVFSKDKAHGRNWDCAASLIEKALDP